MMRNIVATVFGAAVANMIPFLFLQGGTSGVSAAWMWPARLPECEGAAPDMWDFDGKATIAAGETGNVTCKNGETPSVATVSCPVSHEAQIAPEDPDWWGPCGFGDKCLANLTIGNDVTCAGSGANHAVISVAFALLGLSLFQ